MLSKETKQKLLQLENLLDRPNTSPTNTPTLKQFSQPLLFQPSSKEESEQELISQVLQRSSRLVKTTERFSYRLSQDERILRDAEMKLDGAVASTNSRREAIQKVTKGTWTTTIMVWVSVLVCVLGVMYMILFMKIFSKS